HARAEVLSPVCVPVPPGLVTPFGSASLTILAGRSSTIVTGSGPQSKVITPPSATASMNASAVQLTGLPSPTTRSGDELSAAAASAGTVQSPSGLPAGGPAPGSIGVWVDEPPVAELPPVAG